MRHPLLFFVFLLLSCPVVAQHTKEINSNRPSQSMGAYSVSKTVFQLESGFGFQKDEFSANHYGNHYLFDVQLRYGVLNEYMELVGDFKLNWNTVHINGTSTQNNGIHQGILGVKYMVYDGYRNYQHKRRPLSWKANKRYRWRRLVPAVALFAGVDLASKKDLYPEMPEANLQAMLIIQQHITDRLSLVLNGKVEHVTDDVFRSYAYIATLSYGFTRKWSVFAENQGYFRNYTDIPVDFLQENYVRGGFTFLVHNNLQLDISGGGILGHNPNSVFAMAGASWRTHKKIVKIPAEENFIDDSYYYR